MTEPTPIHPGCTACGTSEPSLIAGWCEPCAAVSHAIDRALDAERGFCTTVAMRGLAFDIDVYAPIIFKEVLRHHLKLLRKGVAQ